MEMPCGVLEAEWPCHSDAPAESTWALSEQIQGGAAGLNPALCVHCQVGTRTTGLRYPGSV